MYTSHTLRINMGGGGRLSNSCSKAIITQISKQTKTSQELNTTDRYPEENIP